MNRAMSAVVHGIVQGVAFRYHTRSIALGLGLVGTVRNLPSGAVSVWAEGDQDSLNTLVEWLHRGPGLARVSRVDVQTETPRNEFTGFSIIV